jgi:hypothetical protein
MALPDCETCPDSTIRQTPHARPVHRLFRLRHLLHFRQYWRYWRQRSAR